MYMAFAAGIVVLGFAGLAVERVPITPEPTPPICEKNEIRHATVLVRPPPAPRSLNQEPLARREKAVEQRFGECIVPMIVSEGIGREQR